MTMYYQTGADILQDVLFRAGELTALSGSPVSNYLPIAQTFVQRCYYDVLTSSPWPWALSSPPGVLTINPQITGTGTFTIGSTAVTLDAQASSNSLVGWWIWESDDEIPYRIISNSAGSTSIGIDAAYTGPTAGDNNYVIFQDEYQLPNPCLRLWNAWLRDEPAIDVEVITQAEMQDRFPDRYNGEYPMYVSLVRDNILRIVPWPELTAVTLEYEYTVMPTTDLTFDFNLVTDIPVVPQWDRHVIADAALVLLYDLKNDTRAADITALVSNKMNLMSNIYMPMGKTRFFSRPGQGLWRRSL